MSPPDRDLGGLPPRYRIERELGSGGMSTVYLAFDEKRGSRVALKVLLPELASALGADRFLQEIRIGSKLGHPHILPLYDWGQAGEGLYYTMPYQEAETLRARLDREGQLGIEASLEIARQVAGALDYAHGQGVVHRDIKPENILLTEGGAVVMDFGIARAIDRAGGERLTETGLAMGTPAYMSPEQAEGRERVDGRSDQYSLACVLYEMLAGHPPFGGPTSQVVLSRAAKDPLPPLSSARRTVSVPVEAVIHKALSKVAADRFASAEAFGKALELAEQGVTPRGVTPSSVTPSGETPGGLTPWSVPYRTTVWTELARRRVYQVAVSYLVVAWALVQVAEATFEPLGLGLEWRTRLIWGLIGGFPVAVLLAWVYELTPRGIRRTQAVDVTPLDGAGAAPLPRLALTLGVAAVGVTGAVAFLAGGAVVTLDTPRDSPEGIGPFPPGTDPSSRAVIPFRVDEGLEHLRTGIVDNLLGWVNPLGAGPEANEIRRVWRSVAGADTADLSRAQARRIAFDVGSPWVVHGSASKAGAGRVVVTATMEITETGLVDSRGTVEGTEAEILSLLPRLAAQLVGYAESSLLETVPDAAVQAFATGMNLYQANRSGEAIPYLERAVQADSGFGSAWSYLFYANQRTGRADHRSPLAHAMWANRSTMAAREQAALMMDFGVGGPGNQPSFPELVSIVDSLATAHPDWWEVSYYLAILLDVRGAPYELLNWQPRSINATRWALATIPPMFPEAAVLKRRRFFVAVDWPDADPDSVRVYGRAWADNPYKNAAEKLAAEWNVAAILGDTAAARLLVPRFDIMGPIAEGPLGSSARYGIPLALGAHQAIAAATRTVATTEDLGWATGLRTRAAVLEGRFEDAASGYRELASMGTPNDQWGSRTQAAWLALVEPGLRGAGHEFEALFYSRPDTGSVPTWGWDNPLDRLGVRDLWETVALARPERASMAQALVSDEPGDEWAIVASASDAPHFIYGSRWDARVARAHAARLGGSPEEIRESMLSLEALFTDPGRTSGIEYAALFAAKLLTDDGEFGRALRILDRYRRQAPIPAAPAFHLAIARAATGVGERERAVRAYERYLALRARPDEFARPEVLTVCDELGALAGPESAEAFKTCRP